MKKYRLIALLVLIIIMFGGCAIMELSSKTENVENLVAFSLTDFEDVLGEPNFSSDKVLGPIESSEEAIEKAEMVWLEIYGERIKEKKPYGVLFDKENQVWLVVGSLPEGWLGGVPHILIQKADGKILAVWHTR